MRELEDEAGLLRVEAAILEAKLKARIGTDCGIAGVASWESGEPTRRFALSRFIESEPDVYHEVLRRFQTLDHRTWQLLEPALYREVTNRYPQLDTTSWRSQDKRLYERMRAMYFTSKVARNFRVTGI